MKLAKAISERIRSLRDDSGLSQQDLAFRANLSLSLVTKLEQGKKADPRTSTLLALAAALDVLPGEIINNLPVSVDDSPLEKQNETGARKTKKKRK